MIIALQQGGCFDQEEITVRGQKISPLEFTAKILFKQWKLDPEETELTVLKVILKEEIDGRSETLVYNLRDRYHAESGVPSMSRTTGYTVLQLPLLLPAGFSQRKECLLRNPSANTRIALIM